MEHINGSDGNRDICCYEVEQRLQSAHWQKVEPSDILRFVLVKTSCLGLSMKEKNDVRSSAGLSDDKNDSTN